MLFKTCFGNLSGIRPAKGKTAPREHKNMVS